MYRKNPQMTFYRIVTDSCTYIGQRSDNYLLPKQEIEPEVPMHGERSLQSSFLYVFIVFWKINDSND